MPTRFRRDCCQLWALALAAVVVLVRLTLALGHPGIHPPGQLLCLLPMPSLFATAGGRNRSQPESPLDHVSTDAARPNR